MKGPEIDKHPNSHFSDPYDDLKVLLRRERLSAASTFSAVRQVIGEFRQQQQETVRAAATEQERLRRYAGSDGTDEEGRRLDRREFKETIDALLTIHTCQIGWYQNRGEGYRDDVLQILGHSLTRCGLPEESGITHCASRKTASPGTLGAGQ